MIRTWVTGRRLAATTGMMAWLLVAVAPSARAEDAPATPQGPAATPGPATPPAPVPSPGQPGWTSNLFADSQTTLLGDIYGLRSALGRLGISLGLQETSEVFGNVTGGIHRSAVYDGVTMLSLGIDTVKAFGWEGGIFNVSAFQIHGRNISTDNLPVQATVTSLNASRSTRLWEIWFQQSFLGGALDVKLGQQSLDQEFMISQGSSLFINAAAGYPTLPSTDQYAGSASYPLSALGVRLRALPAPNVTLLAGVFDDNPPGGPFSNDADVRGAEQSGTKFNLGTGTQVLAELQYALNPPPSGDAPPGGLPGVYKLGGWYDSGHFPDQRLTATGLSLADPAGTGLPRPHDGNFSLYAIADQTVWRPDPKGAEAVSVFARVMGAPADRNPVDVSTNFGVTWKAPITGRDNDVVGVNYGYARLSKGAIALAADNFTYTGVTLPGRSSESFVELTYQAQLAPWWTVQPDFQYIFMPGAGIPNPLKPSQRIGNAAVLGLRTNIVF